MKMTLAAACAVIMVGAGMASATTIINSASYTAAGCLGAATCTVGGVKVSAQPQPGATMIETNFRGQSGLGVNFNVNSGPGLPVEPEISGNSAGGGTEELHFEFNPATDLVEIILSHLYSTEEFENDPDEEAVLTVTGTAGSGDLKIKNVDDTDPTGFVVSGSLAGDATVVKSGATNGLGQSLGQFIITNAFASLGEITKLVFSATALQGPTVDGVPGTRGDYSVTLVSRVPLPAAAWMMIAGMAGLGYIGRRRATQAA